MGQKNPEYFQYVPELNNVREVCGRAATYTRQRLLGNGDEKKHDVLEPGLSKKILDTLIRAEEGFTFFQKAEGYSKSHQSDMVKATSPIDLFAELSSMGYDMKSPEYKILNPSDQIAAYITFINAINILIYTHKVSFDSFSTYPDKLELGSLNERETYWSGNITPEKIWDVLESVHHKTYQILNFKKVELDDLFNLGHFYTAAYNATTTDNERK